MGLFSWFRKGNSRSTEELLTEARALVQQGKRKEAIRAYARISQRALTSEILVEIGEVNLAEGDIQSVLANAVQALELEPGYSQARCLQGEVLLREGRNRDAIARFKEARAKNPNCEWARRRLAELCPQPRKKLKAEVNEHATLKSGNCNRKDENEAWARSRLTELNNAAIALYQQGEYRKALAAAQKAARFASQHLDKQDPDFARSRNNLAELYRVMGNYAQAEPLFREAMKSTRVALGELHPCFATTLNNLAVLYRGMGKYSRAEALFRQAMAIRRTALGKGHPDFAASPNDLASLREAAWSFNSPAADDFAASLNNLASLYEAMGDYARAEPLFRQAMEIWGVVVGKGHPHFATSLSNLAELYRDLRDHARAEPLHRQALEIWRAAVGTQHPDFATSLNNLAGLYREMAYYARAEPLYCQALEIRRVALGEQHPGFAATLRDLAELYRVMVDYARAEPLYCQALEIQRTALGEQHPDFATSLNNLAGLYCVMGDYARAEPLYRQALEIQRTALGEQHPDFAATIGNLAELYRVMGDYARAEPLSRQALEIWRVVPGTQHPGFAASLNNLAGLYREMAYYARAEPLYRQALEIRRAALGEQHPHFAVTLNDLALLYWNMGDYAQAEPLFRQALETTRAAVGEWHHHFAATLGNLAVLHVGMDRTRKAFVMMVKEGAIDDSVMGHVFAIGSESQRMAFCDTFRGNLNCLLSLVCSSLRNSPEAIRTALELVLRRKAIVAEAQAAQRDAVLGGAHSHLEPQLHEWSTLRTQIVRKRLAGPGPECPEAHEQQLHQWEAQRERLEAALARQIPEMSLQRRLQAADRRAVALALPEGVALVEFVRFDVFDFKAVAHPVDEHRWEPPRRWQPARYLAFVLPARAPDAVQMIDLGEAGPIDALIELFREGVSRPPDNSGRNMVPLPPEEEVPAWQQAGRALHELLIGKLNPAIHGRTRLFLSPDGNLARLPFGLLPDAEGRRLMDTYTLSYLGSGRDVLRFGAASTGTPTPPLVVANPDFNLGERGPGRPGSSPPSRTWSLRQTLRKYRPFKPLPHSGVEGDHIADSLGVKPWQGREALEGPFKQQCRSPRILHFATHGFALDEERPDPNAAGRGLRSFGEALAHPGPRPSNPLLRAGLALAGVNTWVREGTLPEEAEDGILTAEDVSGLNLLATELVVLSACETGLGEVKTGEGVFGLQRAFTLAGAKTLVMSLWSVDDEATRELMEDFYRRIRNGEGRAAALHNAQQALRQTHPHPYYWGAFICQGNPDPLPPV